IYNPASGRARNRVQQVLHFQHCLSRYGVDSVAEATSGPFEASRMASAVSDSGQYDLVIVNGGDGTVTEALRGLIGTDLPMAIWPGGTENVLASDLGLPLKAEQVAKLVDDGKTKQVTVGRAGDRYFFLMAGIGLDASIVNRVNRALKRKVGLFAY